MNPVLNCCITYFIVKLLSVLFQTRKLGVSCVLVDTGITLEKLRTGLSNYANRSASPNAEPAGGRSAEITWYLDVATG
jgi:hypothetical protein